MRKLEIKGVNDSYEIFIGKNILGSLEDEFSKYEKVLILTNKMIRKIYDEEIKRLLNNPKIYIYELDNGEEFKNLESAKDIIDYMLSLNFSRNSLILTLGGGTICDIGGFVASIFMRGIDFIQIPTSLLAQVDASIGGKVAVNHEKGKNLIGFFKNPKKVLIDINFLKSLPQKEFKSGMAEVIKHAILERSGEYFKFLKERFVEIINLEREDIIEMIYKSCEIKKSFVEADFYEKTGLRACLNLGHTYAHSLENIFDYKGISHGEAVAKGIIFEMYLSYELGYISKQKIDEISTVFQLYNIDSTLLHIEETVLLEKMEKDKKNSNDKIKFIIEENGVFKSLPVSRDIILKVNSQIKSRYLKAVIDIGSNSCRLYIAEIEKKDGILKVIKPIYRGLEVSRLAQNINITGELLEESMKRTYAIIERFKQKAISTGVTEMVAFATSATREAKNGTIFVQTIKDEFDVETLIIPGEMEAKLGFNANNRLYSGKIATVDIGGGSTEITYGDSSEIKFIKSFPIGVVKLKEMFFEDDNYTEETISSAKNYLRGFFKEISTFQEDNFKIIGVAGTVTTNVSVVKQMPTFVAKEIDKFVLTKEMLEDNLRLYLSVDLEKRKKIVGLEPDRADLIISGTLILLIILEKLNKDELIVSTVDNLDGAMVLNI